MSMMTFRMYESFRNSDMLDRRARFDEMGSDDPRLDFWINYFDTVQACVESDLCDGELVSQLFAPYAIASLNEVQCRIVDVRALEQAYNLPKPQGYGLLQISGVESPACDSSTRTPQRSPASMQQTVTRAARVETPAPMTEGAHISATVGRGDGESAGRGSPGESVVGRGEEPSSVDRTNVTAASANDAPAPPPSRPVRGRGERGSQ